MGGRGHSCVVMVVMEARVMVHSPMVTVVRPSHVGVDTVMTPS